MEYKIQDLFEFIRNGANIKQGQQGGYPITRIETISTGEINRDKMGYAGIDDIAPFENYILEHEDILMSHINSEKHLGKSALYERNENERIIHGMNLLGLRVNRERLIPKFAIYLFQTPQFRKSLSKIIKKSVNQASFAVNDLKKINVDIPSVEQQRYIVLVLDSCNNLIKKRQSQITALEELTQSLFLDMFGDPLKNTKELPMKQLGSLLEVKGGYAFKSKDFIDEGVPVIKIGTANKGYFDEKTLAFLPNDYKGKYEDYLVSTGDLLITLTGTVGKDDYGNICRVDGSFNNYLLNQRVAKFEIKSDLTKSYLYHCFKNKSYKEQLTKASRGVRQANISNNDIKKLIIPIPPMEDQIKFEEIILKIDDSKIGFLKSLEEVNNLYNSLLKSAFKGELFQEQ